MTRPPGPLATRARAALRKNSHSRAMLAFAFAVPQRATVPVVAALSRPRRPRPRARRSRPQLNPTDATLLQRAYKARELHQIRIELRKLRGTEPSVMEAAEMVGGGSEEWGDVFGARNDVTVKWMWLVVAVARKMHGGYVRAFPEMSAAVDVGDMVQEGVCGLMRSVEMWDPDRDVPFDAYAFFAIKHAILRAIENQSRPIRLPVHVLNKLSAMRKARTGLEARGASASLHDVALAAGVKPVDARLYLERSRSLWSLDAPLTPATPAPTGPLPTLREFLIDHSVDVARQVERECTREAVAELVAEANLEDLERSVLFLKYGLGDGIDRLRAEVSRILDVRVAKVRRAELSALKKLRDALGDDLSEWTELM